MWMPFTGPGGDGQLGLQAAVIGPVTVGLGTAARAGLAVIPAASITEATRTSEEVPIRASTFGLRLVGVDTSF